MGMFGGGKKPEPPKPSFDNVAAGSKPAKKADFSNVKAGGSSTAPAPAAEPAKRAYTVAPGDSLWKIAKAQYGDGNKWRRIYEANREVIGDNPDLIRPGQELAIPDPAA